MSKEEPRILALIMLLMGFFFAIVGIVENLWIKMAGGLGLMFVVLYGNK